MSAGEASVFPPIPKDHPLTEAARIVNAYSEEQGLEATIAWLRINASAGEIAYLGEQRALRAVAAAGLGLNMHEGTPLDEHVARTIVGTPLWRDMRMLLVGCYMDGIAIGWKGRQLADAAEERADGH
jgi:hypothetical protein